LPGHLKWGKEQGEDPSKPNFVERGGNIRADHEKGRRREIAEGENRLEIHKTGVYRRHKGTTMGPGCRWP